MDHISAFFGSQGKLLGGNNGFEEKFEQCEKKVSDGF
jgi:hypothetical protein